MTDIQERLRSVQTRRSQAAAQRTRDEIEEENATKALNETKEALKAEFNVVTGADLKEVREKLNTALETALTEVETQLNASGA
jgi:hypothetical protein